MKTFIVHLFSEPILLESNKAITPKTTTTKKCYTASYSSEAVINACKDVYGEDVLSIKTITSPHKNKFNCMVFSESDVGTGIRDYFLIVKN